MINFLHTFRPDPMLVSFGPVHIYWYGFFIVLGVLAAIFIAAKIGSYYGIAKDEILDLSFWLVIFGIIGARIFHVLIEWPYYIEHPLDVFKVWQGGLAIHGGIIAGLATVYWFSKKRKTGFWKLTAVIVPGLALAQAIGRWGNYFNQELFGRPTNSAWGIPIDLINRPFQYANRNYFQPVFLYESLGDLVIFAALIFGHWFIARRKNPDSRDFKLLTAGYLILYSILRFLTEFIRVDQAYNFLGLRHAQITSLLIIIASAGFMAIVLRGKNGRPGSSLEKNS